MADKGYGPERYIEELGISPAFELEEARAELREPSERLEEALARRKAVEEQRRKTRQEVARLRGGRVLADHGDEDEEDDLVAMHLNQFNYWRRGPRR
jgi:uncharacterized protein (DUF3084 family)